MQLEFFEDDLTVAQKKMMMLHTVIAVLCLPFYLTLPVLFGLAISPYVMWMVFKPNAALILPMAIHMLLGSQQRYMMLLACFLYCLVNFGLIVRKRLLILFILFLTALPFFIWYTVMRYKVFGGGIGAGGTFEGLGYYLGLCWFFWGAISFKRVGPTVIKGLTYLALIVVLLFASGVGSSIFTRYAFWAFPLVPVFFVWGMMQKTIALGKLRLLLGIGTVLFLLSFLGLTGYPLTFTLLGTAGIGIVYLVLAKCRAKSLFVLCPVVLLTILTIRMFHAIDYWDRNYKGHGDSVSYSDIKVRDWESFKYKLYRKTMTDRVPVWAASWNAVQKQLEMHPVFVDVNAVFGEYDFTDNTGHGRTMNITISAHNMFLEMLRLYGLWGGLSIYLIFILIPSLPRSMKSLKLLFDTPYEPIMACCVAHIVVGGQTGQYPISPQFTFYLFGFLGICFARATTKQPVRRPPPDLYL